MVHDDINNEMKPDIDNHQEELLEHLVDMMEEGHILTDEELQLLAEDSDAAEAYRQLAMLRNVTVFEEEKRKDKEQEQPRRTTFSILRSPFAFLAAAAAILALFIVIWPRQKGQPLVYEPTEKADGIILKSSQRPSIDISAENARVAQAILTRKEGQIVLDYQTLGEQGYVVGDAIVTDTVEVPCGKDFKLVLADGTEVWLYAESRLVYPSHFVGDERRVLLEGEAYFRVAKDAGHPFVIITDQMQARVLGTELNVCSAHGGRMPHVALITGSVEVKGATNGPRILKPGEGVTIGPAGSLQVAREDMTVYTSWRDGYVLFDNVTLADVAGYVGRWFNVSVSIGNEQKQSLRLHFVYKRSDSLQRVLQLLNNYGEFHAEYADGSITIN